MIRSETLIPLVGGAYQARSLIADIEVCENLFPEVNPQETESPTPVTHYPREGKRLLSAPPQPGPGRGVYTASNGALYAAVGASIYSIDQNWNWTSLGAISNSSNPISMSDNGTNAVVVDGSTKGFQIKLETNVFSEIIDSTGIFTGSINVDFSDTFMAFATPGTNIWYITLSNQIAFNALVLAGKDSNPDPIVTFAFNIRQAWLIGAETTEVWYLAGGIPFPYQSWPNVLIPYGCVAPYSLAQADVDLYWLSRNKQGQTIAVKSKGYGVVAISTRALEAEWSSYPTVADCIASSFQQYGHTFVLFTFPAADKTWVYDLSTTQWHRRTSIDKNGVPHRDLTTFHTSVGDRGGFPPTIIGQDWATGQIYALDPKCYTDNGMPIVFRRSFPHVMKDMKEITHASFVADFETGGTTGTSEAGSAQNSAGDFNSDFNADFAIAQISVSPPTISMRYSSDGGGTWSNYRRKQLVSAGHYRSMMRWRGLGQARDRVYELEWSFNGPSALQGAYLDPVGHSA